MCGSMVDIHSATAEIRRGKEEEERINGTKIQCPHLLLGVAMKNIIKHNGQNKVNCAIL